MAAFPPARSSPCAERRATEQVRELSSQHVTTVEMNRLFAALTAFMIMAVLAVAAHAELGVHRLAVGGRCRLRGGGAHRHDHERGRRRKKPVHLNRGHVLRTQLSDLLCRPPFRARRRTRRRKGRHCGANKSIALLLGLPLYWSRSRSNHVLFLAFCG